MLPPQRSTARGTPTPWRATRALGLLSAAGAVAALLTWHSDPWLFVDLPTMVGVFALTGAIVMANHGWAGAAQSIGTLLAGGDAHQISRGTAFFVHAGAIAMASGTAMALIGMVKMLQAMDDPTAIGPALAVALLGPVYGVLAALAAFTCAALTARQPAIPSP